jgi:hypothetical protein
MKYLTFFALIANLTSAAPVVGGITKDMECKDSFDGTLLVADCTASILDADYEEKCYNYKLIPEADFGLLAAISWSDATE